MKISDEELAAEIKAREAYGDGQGVTARAFRELLLARKVVETAQPFATYVRNLRSGGNGPDLEEWQALEQAVSAHAAAVNQPASESAHEDQ